MPDSTEEKTIQQSKTDKGKKKVKSKPGRGRQQLRDQLGCRDEEGGPGGVRLQVALVAFR